MNEGLPPDHPKFIFPFCARATHPTRPALVPREEVKSPTRKPGVMGHPRPVATKAGGEKVAT